jgi:hypothetical protein
MASSNETLLDRIAAWPRLCVLGLLVLSFSFAGNLAAVGVTATVLLVSGLLLNHKQTLHLFFSVIAPFAVFTGIVAYIAVPSNVASPSNSHALASAVSWQAYTMRFVKVSGVCLTVSLFVGSLSPSDIYRWLAALGVHKHVALQFASPLVLVQALAYQLKTILDARLAQGYVRSRGVAAMAKQLVPVLTILVSSGLTMALERGDIWREDDILSLLENGEAQVQPAPKGRWAVSTAAVLSGIVLSLANLYWKPAG